MFDSEIRLLVSQADVGFTPEPNGHIRRLAQIREARSKRSKQTFARQMKIDLWGFGAPLFVQLRAMHAVAFFGHG